MKRKNIILIGAPGSGKGTQGDILKEDFNLLKVAPGDILREYRKDKSKPLTRKIDELLDQGKLLPDEIVNQVTEDYIKINYNGYNGIMFDGYPRSLGQAEFCQELLLKMGMKLSFAVLFNIKPSALIDRLVNRFLCKGCGEIYNKISKKPKIDGICDVCGHKEFTTRTDDSDENVIKTRFSEFEQKTSPVIAYYKTKKILKIIDADRDMFAIYNDLRSLFDEAN